jgi:hypothetical protein
VKSPFAPFALYALLLLTIDESDVGVGLVGPGVRFRNGENLEGCGRAAGSSAHLARLSATFQSVGSLQVPNNMEGYGQ